LLRARLPVGPKITSEQGSVILGLRLERKILHEGNRPPKG
jgi:hypothetical protein